MDPISIIIRVCLLAAVCVLLYLYFGLDMLRAAGG